MNYMKIFIFLVLLCPNLFATQTRLLALGMKELDNDGSYYIKDDRNIFLNPAYVNSWGDFALFEVGGEGIQLGKNKTTLSDLDTPKALGGFLLRSGSVVWGAYLGNESNTASLLRIVGSAANAAATGKLLPTSDEQIDLFVGWGDSYKWGANFLFYNPGKNDVQDTSVNQGYTLRLGVKDEEEKKDFHINASLKNKVVNDYTSSATQEFEGDLGLHIGGSYQFEPFRLWAYVKTFSWEQSDTGTPIPTLGGQNGTVEGDFEIWNLAIGNTVEFSKAARFYWAVYARQTEIEVNFNTVASAKSLAIPLSFAIEADATDWLQFRGSIYQNIYGQSKNKNFTSLNVVARVFAQTLFGPDNNGESSSLPANTNVQLGAALKFGGLKIDGLLGVSENPNEEPTSLIDLDRFFVRAAVTYKF